MSSDTSTTLSVHRRHMDALDRFAEQRFDRHEFVPHYAVLEEVLTEAGVDVEPA